jgi:hypothetical protein
MAYYLVVAHQTATSPLLLRRAREIAREDRDAIFTLLVPETHVSHALVCDETETHELAEWRTREAAEAFRGDGLRVVEAMVGDPSPMLAVEDAMRAAPDAYDAVVLSTLPPSISRWLHLDLPARITRNLSLPVLHVSEGGEEVWRATEPVRRELAAGRRPRVEEPAAPPQPQPISAHAFMALVALLALHVILIGALGVQVDYRFIVAEVVMLALFGAMLFAVWEVEVTPRRTAEAASRRDQS